MFRDYVFYSEGIGYGLLILGLTILSLDILNIISLKTKGKILTGIILGTSIWVRHTSDSGLIALFFISLAAFGFRYFDCKKRFIRLRTSVSRDKVNRRIKKNSHDLTSSINSVLLTTGIAILVTLPWRIIASLQFDGKPFAMSSSFSAVPISIWSMPNIPGNEYWENFGYNWGCKIDFERCKQLQPLADSAISGLDLFLLAIQSAVLNPLDYIQERGYYFFRAWIPSDVAGLSPQTLIGYLSLFLAPVIMYYLFTIRDSSMVRLTAIWGTFLGFNWMQLFFIHYEPRYFIPVRLLCIWLLAFVFASKRINLIQAREDNSTQPTGNFRDIK
jgi:hypothetical protein